MATVAELKAQADELKLKYPSKIRKADLEALIAAAPQPVVQVPEEVTPELSRRERAALAGAKGESAKPMTAKRRCVAYLSQRGMDVDGPHTPERFTARQNRRLAKKLRAKASV